MRLVRRVLAVLLVLVGGVLLWNAPFFAPALEGQTHLIAHRGVHQIFSREDLGNDTCTAERILPPTHDYLENTLPSMRAAFDAGADVVELDIHPTTDQKFAVLHDWTIDCRTEGHGVTRTHDMAYLKSLDVGYGYTADGGASFPLRGKGVGLMPELSEVFESFPGKKFLINFKSNEAREADMLAAMVAARPDWRAAIWGAYGGDPPTVLAAEKLPGIKAWSRRSLTDCLIQYLALGWTGYMPSPCRNTTIMLPINIVPFLWGWPNRLVERFASAGSEVIVLGPYGAGDLGTAGIDSLDQLAAVPAGFPGYVWTNRIELIGPALRQRAR